MSAFNIDDRLFGSPISGKVRDELEKRQHQKRNDEGILESLGDATPEYSLDDKTPFVRMWTSLKIVDPEQTAGVIQTFKTSEYNDAKAVAQEIVTQKKEQDPIINQGLEVRQYFDKNNKPLGWQIYNEKVRNLVEYSEKTYIIGDYNYYKNYGEEETNQTIFASGGQTLSAEQQNNLLPDPLQDNQTFKPLAGITGLTSETQEFLGATKMTSVRFVVHNFHDFDRIYNRYFLQPGAKIFVDFGWSEVKDLYDPKDLIDSKKIKEFLYNTVATPGYEDEETQESVAGKELGVITENSGNLEVICGIVVDYSSKVLSNGSVECEVKLQSTNSALLNFPIDGAKRELLNNQIRYGAPYLGVLPFLQVLKEQKAISDDLTATLYLNDGAEQTGIDNFNKVVQDIADLELGNTSRLIPNVNSIATGVFVPNALNKSDMYLSWGFIEDILLNQKFGFGESAEEIVTGDNLNVRFDSSNSFTTFTKSHLEKQKTVKDFGGASPMYLYPETWGDDVELEGESTSAAGSYTYQKGKYPVNFYDEIKNTGKTHTFLDKGLSRIPIREVFIHVDVLETAFDDMTEDKISVIKWIKTILKIINKDSGKDYPIFDWNISSNQLGTEIKIVDNKRLDSYTRFLKSGEDAKEAAVQAGALEFERQNIFFKNLFTLNIMSPNSFVKEYNLEFNLPSGDIGNMYAVQGMSHENKLIPINDAMDRVVAMNGMDNESLSVLYQPDQSAFRVEQLSIDKELSNVTAKKSLEKLVSTNVYTPVIDTKRIKFDSEIELSANAEGVLASDAQVVNEKDYRSTTREQRKQPNYVKQLHTTMINGEGNRVAKDLDDYFALKEEVEVDVGIVNRPNLLPFTLSLTIYGISTIQPGDIFKVDYLPQIYKRNVMLQTMKVIHNVNSDGWFTTLETQFRPLPDIKKPYMIDVEYQATPYLSPDFLLEMLQKYNTESLRSTSIDYGYEYDTIWGPNATESPDTSLNNQSLYVNSPTWGYSNLANVAEAYPSMTPGGYETFHFVNTYRLDLSYGSYDTKVNLEKLVPYLYKIEPIVLETDNFNHISRIFRFQISDVVGAPYGNIYNPHVQRPVFDVDTLADAKNRNMDQIALDNYAPFQVGQYFAHDRSDVMASYLNSLMYMPRPAKLKRGGTYYFIIYKEDSPNAGQAFVIDDVNVKNGQVSNITMDDFLFWDVVVYTDTSKAFNYEQYIRGSLVKEGDLLYDEQGAEYMKIRLKANAERENRKLNRYEVEEIYRQYIRDGKEQEAMEFVVNSGFGPVSSFKGANPSAAEYPNGSE